MANSTRTSRVVSISLPRSTGEELDRLARERALSRSALLRAALREYQNALERAELEDVLRLGARYGSRLDLRTDEQAARLVHRSHRRSPPARRARRPRH